METDFNTPCCFELYILLYGRFSAWTTDAFCKGVLMDNLVRITSKARFIERVKEWFAFPNPKPPIPCCKFEVDCPGACDWPEVSWCYLERENKLK